MWCSNFFFLRDCSFMCWNERFFCLSWVGRTFVSSSFHYCYIYIMLYVAVIIFWLPWVQNLIVSIIYHAHYCEHGNPFFLTWVVEWQRMSVRACMHSGAHEIDYMWRGVTVVSDLPPLLLWQDGLFPRHQTQPPHAPLASDYLSHRQIYEYGGGVEAEKQVVFILVKCSFRWFAQLQRRFKTPCRNTQGSLRCRSAMPEYIG